MTMVSESPGGAWSMSFEHTLSGEGERAVDDLISYEARLFDMLSKNCGCSTVSEGRVVKFCSFFDEKSLWCVCFHYNYTIGTEARAVENAETTCEIVTHPINAMSHILRLYSHLSLEPPTSNSELLAWRFRKDSKRNENNRILLVGTSVLEAPILVSHRVSTTIRADSFSTETMLSNLRDGSSKAKILQRSEPSIEYDAVDKKIRLYL
jgi:hypothetical protein